jgi:ketosteroid isomerase-like protein
MKIIPGLFALLILAGCCCGPKPDVPALLAADRSFSKMSVEKGMNKAFIYYAADSVVKMRDGNFPIIGKTEMSRSFSTRPDTGMILKWTPVKAEVSQSNDLGYTFGEWELYLKAGDTTLYGNYVSIWKKQADGSWKYVLDGGCNTPKPPSIYPNP